MDTPNIRLFSSVSLTRSNLICYLLRPPCTHSPEVCLNRNITKAVDARVRPRVQTQCGETAPASTIDWPPTCQKCHASQLAQLSWGPSLACGPPKDATKPIVAKSCNFVLAGIRAVHYPCHCNKTCKGKKRKEVGWYLRSKDARLRDGTVPMAEQHSEETFPAAWLSGTDATNIAAVTQSQAAR